MRARPIMATNIVGELPRLVSRYDYSAYSKRKLRSRRCVQVSNGKFRCVELSRIRRTKRGAPTVIMHTLADPETAEWTVEYVVFFDEIWDDDTYKASGLPAKAPVIALIHPENPGVLYFFVKDYLVGFDMRARKLVCQAREPTKGAVSPSDVLALVLPPALTAGLPVEVSDGGVKEDEPGAGTTI